MVNVELPWNPLRLEQRVGRVDRIGQARCVHAVRLFHRGTIEDTVLARLEARRLLAAASLDDVAAAAWGQTEWVPRPLPPLPSTVVATAASEADRLARERALRPGADPYQTVWCRPRRRTNGAHRWRLLYRLQILGAEGRLAGEVCHAMVVEATRPPMKHLDDDLLRQTAVDVDAQLEPLRCAARRRVQSIADRLRREPARELQATLFDRRAERAAVLAQQVRERLDAALRRRIDSLASPQPAGETRATLIAAWPVEP